MISAANASQICDGASAALIVSEQALKDFRLIPKARIVNLTVTAGDPVIMLEAPLPATTGLAAPVRGPVPGVLSSPLPPPPNGPASGAPSLNGTGARNGTGPRTGADDH